MAKQKGDLQKKICESRFRNQAKEVATAAISIRVDPDTSPTEWKSTWLNPASQQRPCVLTYGSDSDLLRACNKYPSLRLTFRQERFLLGRLGLV